MILKRVFAILVVAAIVFPVTAPRVDAAPATDIWTHYYDCAMIWMGTKFRGCASTGQNYGIVTGGYYKNTESCSCTGTTCTNRWYKWNGTGWTQIYAEPNPPDC
jgi:hypothetical protein